MTNIKHDPFTALDMTLAERFCATPDAMAFEAPFGGSLQTVGMDDSCEVRFRDGSVACCLNGGEWLPCGLNQAATFGLEG